MLEPGMIVWVPTTDDRVWAPAKILAVDGSSVKCAMDDGKEQSFPADQVDLSNPEATTGGDNLTLLGNLNAPEILQSLRMRYSQDNVYTRCGEILIAVNPFKSLDIYDVETILQYSEEEGLPPHIYETADKAFALMAATGKQQSIIVSGESGAGKTETTKLVLQYISEVAGSAGVGYLENKIREANPLMEAFGNAKTLANNNSSRFGKFLKVQFAGNATLVGVSVDEYLLERSRVVSVAHGERNYHIFYQLLAGANSEQRSAMALDKPETYHYLNCSSCYEIEEVSDSALFERTYRAMQLVGFSEEDREAIISITAGLLHFGNTAFKPLGDEGCTVDQKVSLDLAAKLLGVSRDGLLKAVCFKQIKAGLDFVSVPRRAEEAVYARDALTKAVYSKVFSRIIQTINNGLSHSEFHSYIGLLDIFGFEVFEHNSFEQLCINFANEKLQSFFNKHVFEQEQVLYKQEELTFSFIDYPNNQICLDLIDGKPPCIATMLDEECIFPGGSDVSFHEKLVLQFNKKHPSFEKPPPSKKFPTHGMRIKHYAGAVVYDVTTFLDKNNDTLHADFTALLQGSEKRLLANVFASAPEEAASSPSGPRKKARSSKFVSVLGTFRSQLKGLMEMLQSTRPHFVRCIKPNYEKKPGWFDNRHVTEQLRCGGVLEAVRVQLAGWPTHLPFEDFYRRFFLLAPKADGTPRDQAAAVLTESEFPTDKYQIGKTQVFFRALALNSLEKLRDLKLLGSTITLQRVSRGHRSRTIAIRRRASVLFLQRICKGVPPRCYLRKSRVLGRVLSRFIRSSPKTLAFRQKRSAGQLLQAVCLMASARRVFTDLQQQSRSNAAGTVDNFESTIEKLQRTTLSADQSRKHAASTSSASLSPNITAILDTKPEITSESDRQTVVEMIDQLSHSLLRVSGALRPLLLLSEQTSVQSLKTDKLDLTNPFKAGFLQHVSESEKGSNAFSIRVLAIVKPPALTLFEAPKDMMTSSRLVFKTSVPLKGSTVRHGGQLGQTHTFCLQGESVKGQLFFRADSTEEEGLWLGALAKAGAELEAVSSTHLHYLLEPALLQASKAGNSLDIGDVMPDDDSEVKGWLSKKGGGESGVYTGWKRRWFVFSGGVLKYYKSAKHEGDGNELGMVPIGSGDVTLKRGADALDIEIVLPHRSYALRADKADSLVSWVKAFLAAMHRYDQRAGRRASVMQSQVSNVGTGDGKEDSEFEGAKLEARIANLKQAAPEWPQKGHAVTLGAARAAHNLLEDYLGIAKCLQPDISGFLYLGKSEKSLNDWARYWAVLNGKALLLYPKRFSDDSYFRATPIKVLQLVDFALIHTESGSGTLFIIAFRNKRYRLRAKSQAERFAWVNAIEHAKVTTGPPGVSAVPSVQAVLEAGVRSTLAKLQVDSKPRFDKWLQEQAVEAEEESAGDIEGYLEKSSTTSSAKKTFKLSVALGVSNFNKKWFVLKDNSLMYYHKQGEFEPAGLYPLEGCNVVVNQALLLKNNFEFQLVGEDYSVNLRCKTASELNSWTGAIQTCISNAEASVLSEVLADSGANNGQSAVEPVFTKDELNALISMPSWSGSAVLHKAEGNVLCWLVVQHCAVQIFDRKANFPLHPFKVIPIGFGAAAAMVESESSLDGPCRQLGCEQAVLVQVICGQGSESFSVVIQDMNYIPFTTAIVRTAEVIEGVKDEDMQLNDSECKIGSAATFFVESPVVPVSLVDQAIWGCGMAGPGSVYFGKWSKRFLVLRSGLLLIFKEGGGESEPEIAVPLSEFRLHRADHVTGKLNSIELRHPSHKSITCWFQKEDEYKRWYPALRHTCDAWKASAGLLDERRESERQLVQANDRVALDAGESWYLIEANWLDAWAAFTAPSSTQLPPGVINNRVLLQGNGEPRQGMVRGRDYRGVTRQVWEVLMEAYGGGPMIARPSLNIYKTVDDAKNRRAKRMAVYM